MAEWASAYGFGRMYHRGSSKGSGHTQSQPMGLGLFVCERNSGPRNRRAVDMVANRDFAAFFSFPVFINKSARKKDAVVDRTNLSPKFPLPPHRTNSRSDPDPCREPPRLTDPAPDLLVARRDLSIGTSFAPSL